MEKRIIGKVGKPHGLQGEMRVILLEDAFEEVLEVSEFVFVKGLPYSIRNARQAGGFLLQLEGVNDRSAAEILRGATLELPDSPEIRKLIQDDPLQEWVGFRIHDMQTDRMLGPIEEVIELPTQLTALFTVDGKEVLVPLHENLILGIDPKERILQMNLPDGLLDLYL